MNARDKKSITNGWLTVLFVHLAWEKLMIGGRGLISRVFVWPIEVHVGTDCTVTAWFTMEILFPLYPLLPLIPPPPFLSPISSHPCLSLSQPSSSSFFLTPLVLRFSQLLLSHFLTNLSSSFPSPASVSVCLSS